MCRVKLVAHAACRILDRVGLLLHPLPSGSRKGNPRLPGSSNSWWSMRPLGIAAVAFPWIVSVRRLNICGVREEILDLGSLRGLGEGEEEIEREREHLADEPR